MLDGSHPIFHYRRPSTEKILSQQQDFQEQLSASVEQLHHSFFAHQQQQERLYEQWNKQMKRDEAVKRDILDSLALQETTTNKLAQQVAAQDQLYQGLIARLESQEKMYQKLAEKFELQNVFHETVIKQLEEHEASHYKMIRQLDSLKETIFERCAYIVETIKQTIHSLFTRTIKNKETAEAETETKEPVHM
ncbi:hypothetical protein [Anoxybacteroides tepidamans]|uniref:hypothetical protein n=1 Tax=Anoxybacteroides tepidamans TaxID=265948 RepID=UPI00068525A6|nr:hypothetical protein [Anoxybacillus tepidamans]